MKILFYGINYAPEQTGVGKYTAEMATWLAAAGHQVRVVTAPPYYPAWQIGSGYRSWRHVREELLGVQIWRAPLWVPSRPSGLTRMIHLGSFAFFSIPSLISQIIWRPNVVCVVAPAFACAPAGWLAAKICGAKSWLHIQDFEVDAAFRMGLLRGKFAHGAIYYVERWLLKRFDRVSTISGRMMDLLCTKGISEPNAVHFPNWVDTGAITPLGRPSAYRQELGIPETALVALYSGSMAGKQGLDLLPTAAREAERSLPNLYFVICGDGVVKPGLISESVGLTNIRFIPLQPLARLGELLNLADIHLLTQHSDAADLVMPSKLTGMLSSGRPVLATANEGTELARVVQGKGVVVPPDDLPAFMAGLAQLVSFPDLRQRFGSEARRYAEEHLATDRVLVRFEKALMECVGELDAIRKSALRINEAARHSIEARNEQL